MYRGEKRTNKTVIQVQYYQNCIAIFRPFISMSWEKEENRSRHVDFQCVKSKRNRFQNIKKYRLSQTPANRFEPDKRLLDVTLSFFIGPFGISSKSQKFVERIRLLSGQVYPGSPSRTFLSGNKILIAKKVLTNFRLSHL